MTAPSTDTSLKPHPFNAVTLLRYTALAEGVSFLLLLGVAMPLKYFADMPLYVRYVGMAHGLLFILLVLMLFAAASRVPVKWLLIAFIATFIPFGPFFVDKHLRPFEPASRG